MTAITVEHVEEIIYEHFKAQGELTSKEVYQATDAAMQAIIESGRKEFYNEGYDDGSSDGYGDGYDDGMNAGYDAGYADAKEEFEGQ